MNTQNERTDEDIETDTETDTETDIETDIETEAEADIEHGEAPKTTAKQLLAWVTGDRDGEAKALAAQTSEVANLGEGEALHAAKVAVAKAHGDSHPAVRSEERSDLATTADVAAEVAEANATKENES